MCREFFTVELRKFGGARHQGGMTGSDLLRAELDAALNADGRSPAMTPYAGQIARTTSRVKLSVA